MDQSHCLGQLKSSSESAAPLVHSVQQSILKDLTALSSNKWLVCIESPRQLDHIVDLIVQAY